MRFKRFKTLGVSCSTLLWFLSSEACLKTESQKKQTKLLAAHLKGIMVELSIRAVRRAMVSSLVCLLAVASSVLFSGKDKDLSRNYFASLFN